MLKNEILKGMFIDYTESERRFFITQCEKGIPENRYDTIQITKAEGVAMIDAFDNSDVEAFDMLTRPALPHFTGIIDESDLTANVVFVPSNLPKKVGQKNGIQFISIPKIDAYMYQSCKSGTPDAVIVFSTLKFREAKQNEYEYATIHQLYFTNPNSVIGRSIDYHLSQIETMRKDRSKMGDAFESPAVRWSLLMKQVYVAIQYTLLNRPTVFKERVERKEVSTGERNMKGNIRRKVKTCRFITINSDEFQKMLDANKEPRGFSCPSWGVIGHMRRLKSGKQVWVKPHVKGRERENYSAKEYKIVQGEPSIAVANA